MKESSVAVVNLISSLIFGVLAAGLGIKSCNEGADKQLQQQTNAKLTTIDSTAGIELTNLRTVAVQTTSSIDKLILLDSNDQEQIRQLKQEVDQLSNLYRNNSRQLAIMAKSFDRTTKDSIGVYLSDSLAWDFAKLNIYRILEYVYLYSTRVASQSFHQSPNDQRNLIDTINILSHYFSIAYSNKFVQIHHFIQQGAIEYIGFLGRLANRLTYVDGSYIKVMLGFQTSAERWTHFVAGEEAPNNEQVFKRFQADLAEVYISVIKT